MIKKIRIYIISLFSVLAFLSCHVQFKMNGASIDYTVIKTITIADFPNMAPSSYPPLTLEFNESLKDIFTRQTRLSMVPQNGDLMLEGEIVRYDFDMLSVQSDAFASETRLTIGVKVRFTNNKNHEEDFEETFMADDKFSSSEMLSSVQDELVKNIVSQLVDQIYNRTVANW